MPSLKTIAISVCVIVSILSMIAISAAYALGNPSLGDAIRSGLVVLALDIIVVIAIRSVK